MFDGRSDWSYNRRDTPMPEKLNLMSYDAPSNFPKDHKQAMEKQCQNIYPERGPFQ